MNQQIKNLRTKYKIKIIIKLLWELYFLILIININSQMHSLLQERHILPPKKKNKLFKNTEFILLFIIVNGTLIN